MSFYARRCRRILPAASLVVVATLLATYHWLGFIRGDEVVPDARSAALFFANFHFISLRTNYLTAQRPPSPLQNLWSLSVEEQFYAVYPAFFILLAASWGRFAPRAKLAAGLTVVIATSLVWSIYQTSTNANAAYFSPFTHAWELALGALVAVGTRPLASLRPHVAAALTWLGLAAIVVSACIYTDTTRIRATPWRSRSSAQPPSSPAGRPSHVSVPSSSSESVSCSCLAGSRSRSTSGTGR